MFSPENVEKLAVRLFIKACLDAGLKGLCKLDYDKLEWGDKLTWQEKSTDTLKTVKGIEIPALSAEQVEWVVHRSKDETGNGDLGVKIGDKIYILYRENRWLTMPGQDAIEM